MRVCHFKLRRKKKEATDENLCLRAVLYMNSKRRSKETIRHRSSLPFVRSRSLVLLLDLLNLSATQSSLSYLTTTLPLPATHLIARIGASNLPSIHLFRKLGFGVVKHVQVFDEVELRWGAKDVECLGLEGLEEVTAVDWRETSLHGRIGVYDA